MPGSVKYPGCGVRVMTLELGALGGSCAETIDGIAMSAATKRTARTACRVFTGVSLELFIEGAREELRALRGWQSRAAE